MEIIRTYTHKTFGEISSVTLDVPESGWTLNGNALSAASVAYLATFALQSLQDAYAGSETGTEARASFAKKLDRVIAGTIKTGSRGGGGLSDTDVEIAKLVITHRKLTFEKGVKTADRYEVAIAQFDDMSEAEQAGIRGFAERIIRRRAEDEADRVAALAGLVVPVDTSDL